LGTPFSSVISTLTSEAIAVVEVSSFQLLRCEQFRPAIAVLLNLGINHLDRHIDRSSYVAAKARLFQAQTPEDYAVLNGASEEIVALSQTLHAQRVWFGDGQINPAGLEVAPVTRALLPDNLQAVLQVARLLEVPDPLTYQLIREFPGLEHRLEHVATVRGVRFVNDSKSTTPDSFLYALQRCPGSVVPILGGRDKNMDFRELGSALTAERIRGVVLMGEARHRLRQSLTSDTRARECHSLEEAIRLALELARPGDAVLFSPACASFDMFRNFEERGQAFKSLVRQLADGGDV
jgi:UDP-N-acetylmuramoylalanine--D-glutamate ligase